MVIQWCFPSIFIDIHFMLSSQDFGAAFGNPRLGVSAGRWQHAAVFAPQACSFCSRGFIGTGKRHRETIYRWLIDGL